MEIFSSDEDDSYLSSLELEDLSFNKQNTNNQEKYHKTIVSEPYALEKILSKNNDNSKGFKNLPIDLIIYMINIGGIKGKDLISLCLTETKVNKICNRIDKNIFRKLIYNDFPFIKDEQIYPNIREYYIILHKRYHPRYRILLRNLTEENKQHYEYLGMYDYYIHNSKISDERRCGFIIELNNGKYNAEIYVLILKNPSNKIYNNIKQYLTNFLVLRCFMKIFIKFNYKNEAEQFINDYLLQDYANIVKIKLKPYPIQKLDYFDWINYSENFSFKLSDLMKLKKDDIIKFLDFSGDYDITEPLEINDKLKIYNIYDPYTVFKSLISTYIHKKSKNLTFIGNYLSMNSSFEIWIPSDISWRVKHQNYERPEDISVGSRVSFILIDRLSEMPKVIINEYFD